MRLKDLTFLRIKKAKLLLELSNSGFTLVELLVVVTIIALLGTIGISAFIVAQRTARDGKKIADINSIAKSIESSKNYSTGTYAYSGTALSEDFPRGITADIKYAYCIKTSTGTDLTGIVDPTVDISWTVNDCPDDYLVVNSSMEAFAVSTKSWKLCALLEKSNSLFCITSLIK
ncbi:prepilin-type N-terminal cleavage/methylation domain-containing protein [Patescibacteria group bacterium]|nr:prepilin-type N-terminal cleavage/methylation domain-containing protein [Patescibacteria group bacterium]